MAVVRGFLVSVWRLDIWTVILAAWLGENREKRLPGAKRVGDFRRVCRSRKAGRKQRFNKTFAQTARDMAVVCFSTTPQQLHATMPPCHPTCMPHASLPREQRPSIFLVRNVTPPERGRQWNPRCSVGASVNCCPFPATITPDPERRPTTAVSAPWLAAIIALVGAIRQVWSLVPMLIIQTLIGARAFCTEIWPWPMPKLHPAAFAPPPGLHQMHLTLVAGGEK
jgi:hypothetical protein